MNMLSDSFATSNHSNVVQQAIDWHMRSQQQDFSADEQIEFNSWLGRDEAHAQAFQRIQMLWRKFDDVEPDIIKPMLSDKADFFNAGKTRKKYLKKAGVILPIIVIGLMIYQQQKPTQEWVADYQTNIGEQRTIQLPDNSTLVLNTQTVVTLDYTNQQRHILLKQGELFIKVAKDHNRPLIVSTQNAIARALGTQFMVQASVIDNQPQTKVAVAESQVEACISRQWYQFKPKQCVTLSAGDMTNINQQNIAPKQQADVTQITGWVSGKLAFDNQPLSLVIAELQRYSKLELQLSGNKATLKELRVSGVFPAQDTARSLELLASRLPIHIEQVNHQFIISER